MKIKIATVAIMCFAFTITAQTFKNSSSNTDFNHFMRNGFGAAVYINQISTDLTQPILRLSSGTTEPNRNIQFTVENNGYVGIGTTSPESRLSIGYSENASQIGLKRKDGAESFFMKVNSDKQFVLKNTSGSGDYNFLTNVAGKSIQSVLFMEGTNGNIGIGTTIPNSKLSIRYTETSNQIGFKRKDGAESFFMKINSNNKFVLKNTSGNGGYDFQSNILGTGIKSILFMEGTNGNIGIGTTSPQAKLDVNGHIISKSIKTKVSNTDYSHFTRDGGGAAVYINQISTDLTKPILRLSSGIAEPNKNVQFTVENNGNVGIGTMIPGTWKLAVNGKIRAKEIKVETGWADFVFYENYKLPTLEEVENHIKEKGHLKDIPSAKEVEKNGIFLGEMDSKLLQKIEELTLYTIHKEKEIKALKKQNTKIEKQEKEITELKLLVQKLLNK